LFLKQRVFDWFLIAVVLSGGVLAWQTGRERSRLTARHSRLAKSTGELPIADASKIYALALDTGEPLHFAWHLYFPPNCTQTLNGRFGGQFNLSDCPAGDSIARVRLRHDEEGLMQLYVHIGVGSMGTSFENEKLAALLRDRWDTVKIEQLGAPKLAVMKPDHPVPLLRVSLPDLLHADAKTKLSPESLNQFDPVLLEINVSPPPPKP
jgi:hypothetical protein